MGIGERLDQAMREAGFVSQSEFARRAGTTQPTVNRMLSNKITNPDIETLKKLSSATGVTFNWLATGEGPKKASSDGQPDEISDRHVSAIAEIMSRLDNEEKARIRGIVEGYVLDIISKRKTEKDKELPNFQARLGAQ